MREQLKCLMAELFGCAPGDIPDNADVNILDGWDSLHHLELMLELETSFNVRVPTEAMVELVSLESIESYLRDNATPGDYDRNKEGRRQ